jgi:hypothetical protein
MESLSDVGPSYTPTVHAEEYPLWTATPMRLRTQAVPENRHEYPSYGSNKRSHVPTPANQSVIGKSTRSLRSAQSVHVRHRTIASPMRNYGLVDQYSSWMRRKKDTPKNQKEPRTPTGVYLRRGGNPHLRIAQDRSLCPQMPVQSRSRTKDKSRREGFGAGWTRECPSFWKIGRCQWLSITKSLISFQRT